MRAIEPRESGFAVNPEDNVRIYYEVFGRADEERTIVFLPTWHLVHSRVWKLQVPYFAQRGFRVIVYDPRGNGKSDRPERGYSANLLVGDALAVIRETNVDRATFVTLSAGAPLGTVLAVEHSDLVQRIVFIGQAIPFLPAERDASATRFTEAPPNRDGWNKYNAIHWREDYRDFLDWFIDLIFYESHSTKAVEDTTAWALETTPEILIEGIIERDWSDLPGLTAKISCPVLILHGSNDRIRSVEDAKELHKTIPDSRLVVVDKGGHSSAARDPVFTNELIHDFIGREMSSTRVWPRALSRPRRALFVSSPIGLGHAQRDLAIANELRTLIPDLQIDWLAQSPVSGFLEERGEQVHPMSDRLAGESEHIESWADDDHTLNVFMSIRDMDEILLTNFFVFLDAVRETPYDAWICDEAWDVDHFLFENSEMKTAPYVWLTDVVGYLPGDAETATDWERYVAADYNAELIEQIDRYPALRDRSLYIGELDDLPELPLGPDLPTIPEWTQRTHEFTGYIRYFDPDALPDRARLRGRFNLPEEGRIAVASSGGTSVGNALLRRIIESWPVVQTRIPDLHLVVVGGPRVDLEDLPHVEGVDYRGYVPNLYELFAAADVALVQGGLSTTMELVTLAKPFIYFPLQEHFEQQHHVARRLEQYGVPEWARIQFPEATPELIASRVSSVLCEPVTYRPVEANGARRVAERIAPLIAPVLEGVPVEPNWIRA
jgi:pimeloyl-ACP methyl ester carboxylesterase/UDP:flavonoid glycosyltransferase YjiC (YdhE family)